MNIVIDAKRLMSRIEALGATGRDAAGRLCRLAATDEDRMGRDLLCGWMREAGLRVEVDRIGNIYGIWEPAGVEGNALVIGSHIDTVVDAGIYDGLRGFVRARCGRSDAIPRIDARLPAGRCRLHERRRRTLCAGHDGQLGRRGWSGRGGRASDHRHGWHHIRR